MNKEDFDAMLGEALKENMTVELSFGHSYGYRDKTLRLHLKYKGQTIALEEIPL